MNLTGLTSLLESPAAGVSPSPRLATAAHQFEASMLTELLKPLQERSEFSDKDEDADDSGSAGSMRAYGTEAMARSLSEHGGLGIAKMVLAKLAPVEAAQKHGDTHVSGQGQ
jgi:Rod binding domain-containing protein